MRASPRDPNRVIFLGYLAGLAIAALALAMTGAGHGWGSGVYSSTSILGAPLTAYAWNARGAPRGKRLALAALVVALATDIWLVVATVAEGTDYMATALASGPGVLWCGLFIGWQLLALLTFLPSTAPISHETLDRLRPPDFYLASSESYAFTGPFKCWVQGRVAGEMRDDYLLVRIDPPCIDPFTEEPLADILMAGRVAPTFPLSLPANVYLFKILDREVHATLRRNLANSVFVTQGDIFATLTEAEKLANNL